MAPVPVSLPQELGDATTAILARFTAQTDVDVKWDYLRDDPGGTPFDFTTFLVDAAVTTYDVDGRLWEIFYTLEDKAAEESKPVTPKEAGAYQTYDITTDEGLTPPAKALLFEWTNVAIPATTTKLKVSLKAILRSATSRQIEWSITVTRTAGDGASLDRVRAPVVWLKGPSATDATFTTNHTAQKRTRVLVPNMLASNLKPLAKNSDWFGWVDNLWTYSQYYPGLHAFQLLAACGLNNTPDSAYRKAFYLSAEDKDHHYKDFTLDPVKTAGNDSYLRFSVVHYPPFAKLDGTRSTWANEHQTSYFTMTGIVLCTDDQWWVDICSHYRTRLSAIGALPPLLEDVAGGSVLNQKWVAGNTWVGHAQLLSKFKGVEYAAAIERTTEFMQYVLQNAHVSTNPLYAQIQQYLKGGLSSVENIGRPWKTHPKGLDEGLQPMFLRMAQKGVHFIAYTRPGDLRRDLGYDVDPTLTHFKDRYGAVAGDGTTVPLNVGAGADVASFWKKTVGSEVLAANFSGVYLDAFVGGGFTLSYPGKAALHADHGGNYGHTGRKTILEAIRPFIEAQNLPGLSGADALLVTENHEEGLSQLCDIQQQDYSVLPGLYLLAESVVRTDLGAVPNLSTAARNMTPSLHGLIYGDRTQTVHLQIPLSNAPLASNTDWNPSGGKPGITADELVDVHCLMRGMLFTDGRRQIEQVNYDFYHHTGGVHADTVGFNDFLLDPGQKNQDDTEKDPTDAGQTIKLFVQLLFRSLGRAYAGQFVNLGLMQRPLSVDYSDVNVNRVSNFIANLADWDSAQGVRSFALPFAAGSTTWVYDSAAFELPRVFHSMWKSPAAPAPPPNNVVGLVLVNWSRAAADWWATFVPGNYGISTNYDVKRLVLGGSPTTLAAAQTGTITIGTPAATPTVSLGAQVPAHSIDVITFEPV